MIEKIIELSIKNKFLVILGTLFIILAGIYAMLKIPWMPFRISPMSRSLFLPNIRARPPRWWKTR